MLLVDKKSLGQKSVYHEKSLSQKCINSFLVHNSSCPVLRTSEARRLLPLCSRCPWCLQWRLEGTWPRLWRHCESRSPSYMEPIETPFWKLPRARETGGLVLYWVTHMGRIFPGGRGSNWYSVITTTPWNRVAWTHTHCCHRCHRRRCRFFTTATAAPPPLVPPVGNDVVRKKCFAAVTFCLYGDWRIL